MNKHIIFGLILCLLCGSCRNQQSQNEFVTVQNGQFIRNGHIYQYIGTNFWYGSILASKGEGGNRQRLLQELDSLKAIGINNLRILVGSDGLNGVASKVEPTLQIAPGVYNDTILDGLDYLLSAMKERDMLAVLYLNNSWEWSGGYGQYLEWAGKGTPPVPSVDGWSAFMQFVQQFPQCEKAQELFAEHVRFIVNRVNRYTQIKYSEDPTIMSWQIGNEPRAFSEENKERFAQWMAEVSALIKSIDSNHLVSSGSEGSQGCEGDLDLYEKIHSDVNLDYLTIHIWPYNWGWVKKDSLSAMLPEAKEKTKKYVEDHLHIACKYKKPLVLEEFGYPRDGFQFSKESTTFARDSYYNFVFSLISKEDKGLEGVNFWAWGGLAQQSKDHVYWQKGDDYMGDPAQEQQGLNSVFLSDGTVEEIKRTIDQLHINN